VSRSRTADPLGCERSGAVALDQAVEELGRKLRVELHAERHEQSGADFLESAGDRDASENRNRQHNECRPAAARQNAVEHLDSIERD
jgi:hypothetical protein